jgi:cytochrome c-type biogenesis protein CcmF
VIGSSLLLFAWRAPKIGLGGKFEMVSRESMLLANNVLLSVAAASVFIGTLYPLFMDALGMGKLSVGPPYFEAVFVPLMALAMLLMGLGALARWKQTNVTELTKRVRWGFAGAIILAVLLPLVFGHWSFLKAFGLMLAFWIIASLVISLQQRWAGHGSFMQRVRNQSSSYYGMQLAHLGVAVFIIGVTVVKGYATERDVRMDVGDTVDAGGYIFRFDGVRDVNGPNYVAAEGHFTITRDGKPVTELSPQKRRYNASGMPMTEAAIDTGLFRDLYVSMGEPIPNTESAWAVRVYYKPFVDWIWMGCLFMALGGVLAISDRRYRLHQKTADNKQKSDPAASGEAAPVISGHAASTSSGQTS